MRKWLVLFLLIFRASLLQAQLSDGTTVPDFTFTDLNGVSHNLYTYLNQGKFVAIEVSATWCHPCWLYHTSKSLDSLYTIHDAPGDQTWKVLFIEGDGSTTDAQLNGVGTTQGDWVTGTSFPIMNPSGIPLNDFKTSYNQSSFPTLYLICPNKKAYCDTINAYPRGYVSRWEYAATLCGPVGLDDIRDAKPLTIYPNPATGHTVLYFSLNGASEIKVNVTNVLGQRVMDKTLGMLLAGDHSIRFDVDNLTPGVYFFTVSTANNRFVRSKVIVQ